MRIDEFFSWPGHTEKQMITVELIKEPNALHAVEIRTPLEQQDSFLQFEAKELWKLIGMLQALQRRAEGK